MANCLGADVIPTPTSSPPIERPQRLAIVHFLGWMVGVGMVLAIYRLGASINDLEGPEQLTDQLVQLGFGLTYGTAISGLGLFLWRWRHGLGHGPSQPGHWLLVFAGLGLVIDVGLSAIVHAGPLLFGLPYAGLGYWTWATHQIAGWSLAAVLAGIVVARLRAARWWQVAAWIVLAMTIANAGGVVIHTLAVWGFFRGNWSYGVAVWTRLIGESCCLLFLVAAEAIDRRLGLPRDWLHAAGICTALSLAAVDIGVHYYFVWLRWQ